MAATRGRTHAFDLVSLAGISHNILAQQVTVLWYNCRRALLYNYRRKVSATKPARLAQLVRALDLKIKVVGSISGLVNLTIINCLSDKTLNRGPVWRCYTPSTLKKQAELSVVSFCILALFPVTTNRLLEASLRWTPVATINKRK